MTREKRCASCGKSMPAGDFMCPHCRTVQPQPRSRRERRWEHPPELRRLMHRAERALTPFQGCRNLVLLVVVLTAIAAASLACRSDQGARAVPTDTAMPPPGRAVVRFEGGAIVAEVADDMVERRRGLMHRETLGRDAGMLFLFEAPVSHGFWMKNTLVPLSIAYLVRVNDATYRVAAIRDMAPCERDPCRSYAPGTSYIAALEVNQGWFADHGVRVGTEVVIDLGR